MILDTVKAFLDQDGWHYSQRDDQPILVMTHNGDNGSFQCMMGVREVENQIVFYALCGMKTPKPKRDTMSEFITRVNFGMIAGNFEMDFADGEVRYKTYLDVEGTAITYELVRNLIVANINMMDTYLPGIMRVMFGDVAVEDVIAEIEQGDDDMAQDETDET